MSLAPTASPVARPPPLDELLEADAPDHLQCPISLALLDDPVLPPADGCTYSRAAIEQHFDACRRSESRIWVLWDWLGATGFSVSVYVRCHTTTS